MWWATRPRRLRPLSFATVQGSSLTARGWVSGRPVPGADGRCRGGGSTGGEANQFRVTVCWGVRRRPWRRPTRSPAGNGPTCHRWRAAGLGPGRAGRTKPCCRRPGPRPGRNPARPDRGRRRRRPTGACRRCAPGPSHERSMPPKSASSRGRQRRRGRRGEPRARTRRAGAGAGRVSGYGRETPASRRRHHGTPVPRELRRRFRGRRGGGPPPRHHTRGPASPCCGAIWGVRAALSSIGRQTL